VPIALQSERLFASELDCKQIPTAKRADKSSSGASSPTPRYPTCSYSIRKHNLNQVSDSVKVATFGFRKTLHSANTSRSPTMLGRISPCYIWYGPSFLESEICRSNRNNDIPIDVGEVQLSAMSSPSPRRSCDRRQDM
jgi:hypothetical protein